MIVPVILAGGTGTRLWPLSRSLYPKQLLPLVGEKTMVQDTIARIQHNGSIAEPIIICNSDQRFMVAEQVKDIGVEARILLEPVGRNTAPAVAVAALEAMNNGDDPVMLVLPADHVVSDNKAFKDAFLTGSKYADDGYLITFGIVPTLPETGYGYIKKTSREQSGQLDQGADNIYRVESFVEKPDLETAKEYLSTGQYYWNSGMFMFKASRYLEELEKFAPEMLLAVRDSHEKRAKDLDFIRLDAEAFSLCPSDSIDYAVMEKTRDALVIPLDCGWSDVGSWAALWSLGSHDENGNVLNGNIITSEVKNSYINATSRMVAAIGIENCIVVETADAVLVADKDKAQDVKKIVEELKSENRSEAVLHRRVYRPWGSYECVDQAERFQVKRIIVKPGARLSLQMHHHRAEHWIVVKGTAKVTNGKEIITLSENESTYIPLGVEHRLENPGIIPLEIIEVQSGSYLGEDDIVRFEDLYAREGEK